MTSSTFLPRLLALALPIFLTACDGGSSGNASVAPPPTETENPAPPIVGISAESESYRNVTETPSTQGPLTSPGFEARNNPPPIQQTSASDGYQLTVDEVGASSGDGR